MKGVIKKTLKSKKAEGYVDSGVKILIAVVIGALLLGGVYMLFKDTILPTAQSKVESLFDYAGEAVVVEEIKPKLITFTISGVQYQAEEGMTWEEWASTEYNTKKFNALSNGYVGWLDRRVTTGGSSYVTKGQTITEGFSYSQKNVEVIIMP